MKEIRVTRPERYVDGTPGHTNVIARQGYYFNGKSVIGCISKALAEFPGEKLDVQFWNDERHGQLI